MKRNIDKLASKVPSKFDLTFLNRQRPSSSTNPSGYWFDSLGHKRNDSCRSASMVPLDRESQLDVFCDVHDCIREYAENDEEIERSVFRCSKHLLQRYPQIFLGNGKTQTSGRAYARTLKYLRAHVRKSIRGIRCSLEGCD